MRGAVRPRELCDVIPDREVSRGGGGGVFSESVSREG